MTQTITIREGRANVFVAVEHANSEVVGIHASWSANRFEALEPVRQGVQTGGSTSDLDITHRDRTILTLIVTDDCAGLRLDCEYTRREQTVRTLAGSRIVGLRIAGAPIDEVELGVIRTRAPGRPTSSRPGVAVRRPGLGPRLARLRDVVSAPQLPAGLGIPTIEECARGQLAAGHARNQHAISDDRRAGGVVALTPVGEFLFQICLPVFISSATRLLSIVTRNSMPL